MSGFQGADFFGNILNICQVYPIPPHWWYHTLFDLLKWLNIVRYTQKNMKNWSGSFAWFWRVCYADLKHVLLKSKVVANITKSWLSPKPKSKTLTRFLKAHFFLDTWCFLLSHKTFREYRPNLQPQFRRLPHEKNLKMYMPCSW